MSSPANSTDHGYRNGIFFTTASSAEKSPKDTLESETKTNSVPLLAVIAMQTVTPSLQSAGHGVERLRLGHGFGVIHTPPPIFCEVNNRETTYQAVAVNRGPDSLPSPRRSQAWNDIRRLRQLVGY